MPGWYGVSNVKWLERIELSPRRFMGKFMGRDYVTIMGRQVGDTVEWTETSVTRQLVKSVTARVTRPSSGAGGTFVVQGAAWADGTPIDKVEVQVDGGAWQPARLEANRNPYAWTFWSLEIDPLAAGIAHRRVARDRSARPHAARRSLDEEVELGEQRDLDAEDPRVSRLGLQARIPAVESRSLRRRRPKTAARSPKTAYHDFQMST